MGSASITRPPVKTGTRPHPRAVVATAGFDEMSARDVIVVPGGFADPTGTDDDPLVRWLRDVHPTTTWTTSVCTGSLYLARAGVLDGIDAACHWGALEVLGSLGAVPSSDRVVIRGKVATAAGISSGIDLGLTLAARLAGEDVAKAIQLAIEYDPQPPFDAGSPAKAGSEVIALVAEILLDSASSEEPAAP
nr:DJ-1/PfpI family protein [Aldersonia kunmingensis]